MFLPYGRQSIDDDDVAAVVEVLRGDFLTQGPVVGRFEAALAECLGASEVVVCSSGTAALHIALMALELGPGDVAIVPAMSFAATANAVAMTGAKVVFADVDPDSGLLTAPTFGDALERARHVGTPRVVLPVHLNGQCAPMEELAPPAREAGLLIVEDACHAVGSKVTAEDGNEVRVGACRWSDLAAFSFHPVKTIAMGEGGAVATTDAVRAERLRMLRNHGLTRDPAAFTDPVAAHAPDGSVNPWYYEMQMLGYNYRAPDINCALGLSQLGKLDRFVAQRRALVAAYDSRLAEMAPGVVPVTRLAAQEPAWHLYPVLIDFAGFGNDRATVMRRLRERDVATQVHYIPIPDLPYWRRHADTPPLPGARAYYERVLTLPLFPAMSEREVEHVVTSLAACLASGG